MKNPLYLIVISFLIVSCRQNSSNKEMYDMAGNFDESAPVTRLETNVPSPQPVNLQQNGSSNKKKIIKDGRMGIRVSELEKTKLRIDTLLKTHAGYYANESFNNSDYESSYNLKIRVPGDNFEKFIVAVESGDGEILYKEIEARDVTDEFIDLETRLNNKRNYLERYNALLKQAKSIKEILDIEEKIRALEEEIESTTGRLKYLSDQVDYSTLDLTISKQKEYKFNPVRRDKFSERLKQSLSKGWYGLIDFLLFVFKVWPFWIILYISIFLWKKYKRKKKQ